MLTVKDLPLSKKDRTRMLDIKSRVLLGMHVSREDKQWVLDTVARVQVALPESVVNAAAREGLHTSHVAVA